MRKERRNDISLSNRELKGHYGRKGLYTVNKCFATKGWRFMYIKNQGGEKSIKNKFQFRNSTVESGSVVIARTLFWESSARFLLHSL